MSKYQLRWLAAMALLALPGQALADEAPPLPAELEEEASEPTLPEGLGDEPELPAGLGADEPGLPEGLDDDASTSVTAAAPADEELSLPAVWSGSFSLSNGMRTQDDAGQKRRSLSEARLHIRGEKSWVPLGLQAALSADFIYDSVLDEHEPELGLGEGAVDLREASVVASPTDSVDLKFGRQILTWGTGDLLFINDMFPKDWNAFLIGRDMEYLKAPSDALKVSAFHEWANVDIVYTPAFDADRFPDRRRLSSWDPMQQDIVGRESLVQTDAPDRWFVDDEWAGRVHRRLGRYELAAYAYRGYWKSPAGMDPMTGKATFPTLSVYGASARRPLWSGIFNIEGGYYDSRSDRGGKDAFIRNSEARGLVGFEKEIKKELSLGLQYYAEFMQHHGRYVASQPPGSALRDRTRHMLTMRLSWLALSQSLRTSLFTYYSPSDQDAALMPDINYAIDDHWALRLGANIFVGKEKHTFFGQLERNSNAYSTLRYGW